VQGLAAREGAGGAAQPRENFLTKRAKEQEVAGRAGEYAAADRAVPSWGGLDYFLGHSQRWNLGGGSGVLDGEITAGRAAPAGRG